MYLKKIKLETTSVNLKETSVLLNDIKALDYARYLGRTEICKLIETKMEEESVESRWMKIVLKGEMDEVEKFRNKFQNPHHLKKILELGLIKAVEIGSLRLIDYFVVDQECDVNYVLPVDVSQKQTFIALVKYLYIEYSFRESNGLH